jgi:hypothetical protein
VIHKGKDGKGLQKYQCKECKKYFNSKSNSKDNLVKEIWIDFVFHKQTIRELVLKHTLDKKTIYRYINEYKTVEKKHNEREVRLLVDALYFGSRTENQSWCVIVFRDDITKENLWWEFTDQERESVYIRGKTTLTSLGYKILSVTSDGLPLIRKAFREIDYQMCLVHMERIIVRGTTRKPKLEASIALYAIGRSMYTIDEKEFNVYMNKYTLRYFHFLNEKTLSEVTGESWYTHEELRKAFFSLSRLSEFLFTYQRDNRIPRTTNSIEGHFAHIRDIVNIHRGASKELKQKIIHTILLASTIAPSEELILKLFRS